MRPTAWRHRGGLETLGVTRDRRQRLFVEGQPGLQVPVGAASTEERPPSGHDLGARWPVRQRSCRSGELRLREISIRSSSPISKGWHDDRCHGPAGGKSTVARPVAREPASPASTRARCTAPCLARCRRVPSTTTKRSVAPRAPTTSSHEEGEPVPRRVSIGGIDVTDAIRTAEIDRAVSPVSAAPSVRAALVEQQQRIGRAGDYVVEGRDIGTTVFPEAPVKVFLTASAEERAHRRVRQNVDRGVGSVDYDEVLTDIRRRDDQDSSRATSPLRPADDAVRLDSTGRYIEEVIEDICALAREKGAR
ncbi:MAG: (d)CMP kinase [Eggerthellaceae bacterium]